MTHQEYLLSKKEAPSSPCPYGCGVRFVSKGSTLSKELGNHVNRCPKRPITGQTRSPRPPSQR